MDPAKIRLIRWVVIQERGAEVLEKNPPVPHPVRALYSLQFQLPTPSRTAIMHLKWTFFIYFERSKNTL